MRFLITGGVGFIGTNTTLHFGKAQNEIVIVDDFSRPGVEQNAQYLKKNVPGIHIIKSNVLDVSNYLSYLKKADVIIHLAGQTAVTTSITNPLLDFTSNLQASFTLLESIRQHNPKAIVLYSSTNKVYGDLHQHELKKNIRDKKYENIDHPKGIDEDERLDFISPYGCSKGAFDLYMEDYARIYKLRTVVFRQSCIYGPFQIGVEDQGWVAHFSKQFLLKKPFTIFGDGYQVRDLLHVADLIKAYELAIQNIEKVKGQALNIGGGIRNAYSLVEVVAMLQKMTGTTVDISYQPSRLGDQNYFVSSNKKAKKLLGWQPSIDFQKGLKDLVDWQKAKFIVSSS